MGIFFPNRLAGVEIDYGELRVVELKGRRSAPELLNWGRAPLPAEAVKDGFILQPQVVGEALEQFWKEKKIKSRNVIFGVSNQEVIVRFANFPPVPEEKLEKMIRYQARDFLPISLEHSIMDFAVTGTSGEGKDKLLEVLLVVAPKEMINNFLQAGNRAGLTVRDIHVISLSFIQLLPSLRLEGATALLSLNNGSSNLLITMGEMPRLARHLSSGLQEVAEHLPCSLEEVVEQAGAAPGEPFPEAFIDWAETLLGDIRSSIQYYQAQSGAAAVEQFILLGRGARINGFPGQLEEIFGLPVSFIDPLKLIKKAPNNIAGFVHESADYGVSFALARGGLGE
ncbi:MAG: pilus assembly protein PilM [Firmicutes bacterium]|nr:pilus assembly protein PilM [Bacillota bacterium]